MEKSRGTNKKIRNRLTITILLILVALVALTAATAAWFTIADHARVQTMNLEIESGKELRIDLYKRRNFEDYVRTLSFRDIDGKIQGEKGFSMATTPLRPVTTANARAFTYKNGRAVSPTSGAYLEFTLHFIADKDLTVHLTSANGETDRDGTRITSKIAGLPEAMRISFTADGQTWVYDPGFGDTRQPGNLTTFGLGDRRNMKLSENNSLFRLKAYEDKEVSVHIWLEGTDEKCTDDLKGADYSIKLRFVGMDRRYAG